MWNSDRGEMTDGRQRKTKRRDRKHEDLAELTFAYRLLFYCCCISSVSEVDREGTIDATAFRTINLSDLDLA